MKFKKIDLAMFFVCLAIFKMEGLSTVVKNSLQVTSLIISIYFLGFSYKMHIKDVSLIIIVPIIISTFISYYREIITFQNVFNCIFYMLGLFIFSNISRIYVQQNRILEMFRCLKNTFLIFLLMNLISIFVIGTDDTGNTTYLFGGKFLSLYLVLFSSILIFFCKKKNFSLFNIFICCILLTIFSIYFSCSTGVVLAWCLFLLLLLPKSIKSLLCNIKILITLIILTAFLVFFLETFLNIPLIKNIITGVLHRDLTLSGRLPIYKYYLIPLILKNPIWGYGYGSSILHATTPYWNAQNGLLDYQLNFGICGTISILIMFALAAKSYMEEYWPMYSFMFLLIVAGIWECSYGIFLYVILILIINLNGGVKYEISN